MEEFEEGRRPVASVRGVVSWFSRVIEARGTERCSVLIYLLFVSFAELLGNWDVIQHATSEARSQTAHLMPSTPPHGVPNI